MTPSISCHSWMRLLCRGAIGAMRQLLLAFLALTKRKCRADQSYVGISLREIAQGMAGARLDFFSVEAEIILMREQICHQAISCLRRSAAQSKVFRLPEATDRKRTFLRLRLI